MAPSIVFLAFLGQRGVLAVPFLKEPRFMRVSSCVCFVFAGFDFLCEADGVQSEQVSKNKRHCSSYNVSWIWWIFRRVDRIPLGEVEPLANRIVTLSALEQDSWMKKRDPRRGYRKGLR